MSRPAALRAAAGEGTARADGRFPRSGMALAAVLLATGTALVVVAVRGPAPPSTLQERARAVASTLRCPVCQDLSVADSPSALAGQMRSQISQELRAGRTPAQVRSGFVRSYGDWILLSPPRRGIELAVWAAPVILLVLGLGVAGASVMRWTRSVARGPATVGEGRSERLSVDDRRLLERALSSFEGEEEGEPE